jgi:hypothetical protein
MNRKLIAIALVPLVVGLSGALAFSMFQGAITSTINTGAGTARVSQESYCDFANIGVNHGIKLAWWTTGGVAIDGTSASGSVTVQPGTSVVCSSLRVGPDVKFLSSSISSTVNYKLVVTGFSAGDWIGLAFFDTNIGGGSQALPVTLTYSTPSVTNMAPTAESYFSDCGGGTCTSTPLSTGTPGFLYYWGAPTSPYVACPSSGGIGICTPTDTGSPHGIEYYLFIGLDLSSPNSDMGSWASFSFTTTATA